MARIAGIELPQNKTAEIALTSIYGIGRTFAKKILLEANVKNVKVGELTEQEQNRVSAIIEKNYQVEGELKQKTFRDIKRLKDIRCYRGLRHKNGLPSRGQNTRSNATTRKGKSLAVGGLKHKLEKT